MLTESERRVAAERAREWPKMRGAYYVLVNRDGTMTKHRMGWSCPYDADEGLRRGGFG